MAQPFWEEADVSELEDHYNSLSQINTHVCVFPTSHFSFSVAEIAPFTEQLLNNLYNALQIPGSSENEYIMKGASYLDTTWKFAIFYAKSATQMLELFIKDVLLVFICKII